MADILNLDRTRAALSVYDGGQHTRNEQWNRCRTNADVGRAQAADREAADLVREAFALDTADRNARENAYLIHPDSPWLRQLVRRYSMCLSQLPVPRTS